MELLTVQYQSNINHLLMFRVAMRKGRMPSVSCETACKEIVLAANWDILHKDPSESTIADQFVQ